VQVQRERAGLVPRPLQRTVYLVQAGRDALSAALSDDGQHVLELVGDAVEIIAAEPGRSEVQPGQAQLAETALLQGVGFVELDGMCCVAFGVGIAVRPTEPSRAVAV
jgi:hypothetical protein